MNTRFLLPHSYKRMGWWLFVPSLIGGALIFFGGYEPEWLDFRVPSLFHDDFLLGNNNERSFGILKMAKNNLANEIVGSLLLISCMLLVFARERDEDEFIMKLRLESLLWASFVNGALVLFTMLFTHDFVFFYVMVFNLYLLFILFIIRFHYVLVGFRRQSE